MAKKQEEVKSAEEVENVVDTDTGAGTSVVNWEDQLAKYAETAAKAEDLVGGKFLSLKAGRLAIDGQLVAGNALDCIIIASAYENAYYVGKFDPQNPAPPKCYAFGNGDDPDAELTMVPHPNVKEPQAKTCAECPHNEWGSDPEGGKGKACKNTRRLALLPADAVDKPDTILDSEQIYLKFPVTSVKSWGHYVHAVAAQFKRPPFAVITTISAEPDTKTQFKVTLKCKDVISSPAAFSGLIKAHELAIESVKFPYPEFKETPKSEKF